MGQTLEEALKLADLRSLILRLEHYASGLFMRKLWRGHRLGTGSRGQLLADGKSADGFVQDAFTSLIDGDGGRTYREDLDLETNLKRTIESMISNWKKKSDRKPLLDRQLNNTGDDTDYDPIGTAMDKSTEDISAVERKEICEAQKCLFDDFKESLTRDSELTRLFEAYENDYTKPAEIELLTGIPAKRIYELKRKLEMKFTAFVVSHPSTEVINQ